MTNPISSTHASNANQASEATARPPQTPAQAQPAKATAVPQDTVKLSSAGSGDHDGDKT